MEKNALTTEEYAARLRGARAIAGWTLDQMGELLNISPQGLSKRENSKQGTTEAERLYFAVLICRETGLPMEWFTEPDRSKLGQALGPPRGEQGDDLSPGEVVRRVEGEGQDGDGAADGQP